MLTRRIACAALLVPSLALAQGPPGSSRGPLVSAARYRVRVDTAAGLFAVRAEFDVVAPRDTVLLSLPVWSPGAYDIDNYARWVHGARAEADGRPAFWDKAGGSTWRVAAGGAHTVALEFVTNPDSAMLQFSEIERGFAFFNLTNLLVYPEGTNYEFPADLTVEAPAGWRLATGLPESAPGTPGRYHAGNYHDLVDAPFFAGRPWMDSVVVDGRPIRLVVFPDSAMSPAVWDSVRATIVGVAGAQNRIFGGPPYDRYTILLYAPFKDMNWGGGLEHHNSQLDALAAPFFATDRARGVLGDFTRPLLAHEFFHLWNVKRIRPAALWPYDYGRAQQTPLLWWSEGVTDYYSDVALSRGGLWTPDRFLQSVTQKITEVEEAAEIVSAEDASLDTWIHPTYVDEAQYYYPKGSLLGLMLDVRIREATGNRRSLDDVMRALWTDHYQRGRGFTTQDLLAIIRRWYPGVDEFYRRYVQGRDPLPYADVLARAGILVRVDSTRSPRIGVEFTAIQDGGLLVGRVAPGSMAAEAGLQAGDVLMRVGDVSAADPQNFSMLYRSRYGSAEGTPLVLAWTRAGQQMTGQGTVRMVTIRSYRVLRDPAAPAQAAAILDGIVGGR